MSDALYSPSLEGVVVGQTAISDVDGAQGRLSYRGVAIDELAKWPYLDVALLVITGKRAPAAQIEAWNTWMLGHCQLSPRERSWLELLPPSLHTMEVLQSAAPALAAQVLQPPAGIEADPDLLRGLFIAAKLPAFLAAKYRQDQKLVLVEQQEGSSLNERFLFLLHGSLPTAEQVRALDTVQILQLEHSYNAGTFAGRVCASTNAPIASSISASIGTLFGNLHGGADEAVMGMAKRIGRLDNVKPYIDQLLGEKGKVMGMGHREYKRLDPRAAILKPMAEALCHDAAARDNFELLKEIERYSRERFLKKGKDIWANLEFYKGAVFEALGIAPAYYTGVFACSRVFGYVAHFMEFRPVRKLIRPRAQYRPQ
ncbi:citrate/2-methylcitrate synthase [Pseudomonas sp. KNUC1026]|uniref:citrate/2-methylcitrate synthase n=1 Tax=Pseudomonas sp. KNUC1026 TaxID=2893890 RepID=UPI001F21BE5F|nr:citrate/2-methylcitrate synthase [Pseudomonas sp. KNUC1026]UFH49633.1 citrate/2-methylcitrate synthase [Pseudomonas sp. KNUC1026]